MELCFTKAQIVELFECFKLKNVNFQRFDVFKSCFQAQVVNALYLGLTEASRKPSHSFLKNSMEKVGKMVEMSVDLFSK